MKEKQVNELTDREADVVRIIATGATNRQIADQLSISPETVKTHVSNIIRKLDVVNRTEAVTVAYLQGYITKADISS